MAARRNVLLITVDQWRGDCLSVAGHPVVATPAADAVAARGVRFANHWSVTAPCGPGQTYSGGPHAYDDACPAFWERAQRYGEREPRA